MANKHYSALEYFWQEYYLLDSFESLLRWDEAVVMPPAGVSNRAKQLAYVKKRQHAVLRHDSLKEHLRQVQGMQGLDPWQKANIKEFSRLRLRALAVPSRLLEEIAAAQSLAEKDWCAAFDHNNPRLVEKSFGHVASLIKEKGECLSQALQISPYEALAQEYDPCFSLSDTSTLFREIETRLPTLITKIRDKAEFANKPIPISMPIEKQMALCRTILKEMGIHEENTRFDQSRHPFTESMPSDVRLTVKYDENDFTSSILAVLHEGGHALYDLHLPLEHQGSPAGRDAGMSVHESQGLLWENFIGRSEPFISWLVAQEPTLSKEQLSLNLNSINLKAIRLYSDEVSYLLHIILRFEIEKILITEKLSITDICILWDQLSIKYFGEKPSDFRTGFLQDIHWFVGYIGYFPMYGIGMVTASQIHDIFTSSRKNSQTANISDTSIFSPLLNWIDTNVFKKGRLFTTKELIKDSKEVNFNSDAIFNYFTKKYLP